jgi:hypothetical protein
MAIWRRDLADWLPEPSPTRVMNANRCNPGVRWPNGTSTLAGYKPQGRAMLPTQAEDVMNWVRNFFKTGHKSFNKLYHVDFNRSVDKETLDGLDQSGMRRFNKRWKDHWKSMEHRVDMTNDP